MGAEYIMGIRFRATSLGISIAVLFGLCLVLPIGAVGDDDRKTKPTENVESPTITYECGRVSLDDGPQRVSHEFRVGNGSRQPVDILAVKRTCGCVESTVSESKIQPGSAATINLTLEIKNPGEISHGAHVVLSNGQTVGLRMTAYGVRGYEIYALRTGELREGEKVRVRFYVIDAGGNGETIAPVVIEPAGVDLDFDGWIDLERHDVTPTRPTRQIGNAILDLAELRGQITEQVKFRTGTGAEATITLVEPAPPSCP